MKKSQFKKQSFNIRFVAVFALLLFLPLVIFFVQESQDYRQRAQTAQMAITIQDFQFSPATITVPVGTTITWTNRATNTAHTTTSDAGGNANSWDSGILTPGKTFSKTFNQAGTFTYHCNIHTFMKATIIVTAAVPTVAPTAVPPTAIPPTAIPATIAPSPTTQPVPSPACVGGVGAPPCATIAPTSGIVVPTLTSAPITNVSPLPTTAPLPTDNNVKDNNGLIAILMSFIALLLKLLQSLFG